MRAERRSEAVNSRLPTRSPLRPKRPSVASIISVAASRSPFRTSAAAAAARFMKP